MKYDFPIRPDFKNKLPETSKRYLEMKTLKILFRFEESSAFLMPEYSRLMIA